MKKYQIQIDTKIVTNYYGTTELPLKHFDYVGSSYLTPFFVERYFIEEELTSEVVAKKVTELLNHPTLIPTSEMFAGNGTFLTFSRVEDANGDPLQDEHVDAFYATYHIIVTEVNPIPLAEMCVSFTEMAGFDY